MFANSSSHAARRRRRKTMTTIRRSRYHAMTWEDFSHDASCRDFLERRARHRLCSALQDGPPGGGRRYPRRRRGQCVVRARPGPGVRGRGSAGGGDPDGDLRTRVRDRLRDHARRLQRPLVLVASGHPERRPLTGPQGARPPRREKLAHRRPTGLYNWPCIAVWSGGGGGGQQPRNHGSALTRNGGQTRRLSMIRKLFIVAKGNSVAYRSLQNTVGLEPDVAIIYDR